VLSHAPEAALALVAAHFAFSVGYLLFLSDPRVRALPEAAVPWLDAAFAALLAFATAGTRSPFYAFTAFAIVASALDGHPRRALRVAFVCVGFYVGLVLFDNGAKTNLVVMRAVYLASLSYLVTRLAERRFRLEADLRRAESATQREHFAREIHDGCAQLLAALDVRLETNRALIRAGRGSDALADLARLRETVQREQRELRAFARRLAATGTGADVVPQGACATRFRLDLQCDGSADVVTQILAMVREALRNVERHASAASATVRARANGSEINVDIQDDGVGFGPDARPPWTIASRVAQLGGLLRVRRALSGAHLSISLPKV
jgi:signal transduction histidine kinase